MNVYLCSMNSENNAINKSITTIKHVTAVAKGDCSIYRPTLILSHDSTMENINYLYIPEFERYYFITNITGMTGSRYEVTCKCDVLESFKEEILGLRVILDSTQNTGKNNYLNGEAWVHNVKDMTFIEPFPRGLRTEPENILITAGGLYT